jgi:hypothetical protein
LVNNAEAKKNCLRFAYGYVYVFGWGGIKNFPFFFPPSTLNTPSPPLNMSINKNLCVGEERKRDRKKKNIFC